MTYVPDLQPRHLPASKYRQIGKLVDTASSTDAQEQNRVQLQYAQDQLSGDLRGGTVWPGRGRFWIDRPLQGRNKVILGGEYGLDATNITPGFDAGPVIIIGPVEQACAHGPALLTGEDWSLNFKLGVEGSGYLTGTKRMIDYGQLGVNPRNWQQLNLELTYQLIGSPSDTDTLWMIGGQRTTGEGYSVALWFRFASGQLFVEIRISAPGAQVGPTTPRTVLSVPTVSTIGTTYHVALDWDGTTVRLWHAPIGTVMSTPVASALASGVFTTKGYEGVQLGLGSYGQFPDPQDMFFGPAPGYIGGHRFGHVSKRSVAYTAPTAAYTPTATDHVCFVCTTDGPDGKELSLSSTGGPGSVYFTRTRGAAGFVRLVRSNYAPIEHAGVQDITIDCASSVTSRGNTGLLLVSGINSRVERVHANYCHYGIIFQNNSYLSSFRDCDVIGGPYNWSGQPTNGQQYPRIGMAIGGATGVVSVEKLKSSGFQYGFCSGYGAFFGNNIWVIETSECKAFFTSLSTMKVNGLLLADEGDLADNDYALLLETTGIGNAFTVDSAIIECGHPFAPHTVPIGISGTEFNTQVSFKGLTVRLNQTVPQPEIFHFLNQATVRPVAAQDMIVSPAQGVVTLNPGKVVRDGVAQSRPIPDASGVIAWHEGKTRALPILTASRVYDLDNVVNLVNSSHPYDGATIEIVREGVDAFTATIRDGIGGPPLCTFPAGLRGNARFVRKIDPAPRWQLLALTTW